MDLSIHFEPSGAKVQEREVEILDDDLNEGNEWFSMTLSRVTLTSMCYKIENGTLNMTIGDNDGTYNSHILWSLSAVVNTLSVLHVVCVCFTMWALQPCKMAAPNVTNGAYRSELTS